MKRINGMVAYWQLLATDTELSAYVTQHDIAEFKRRALAEGDRFLTVELPKLGKALEAALASGVFELPAGFKQFRNRPYPAFLNKAWSELLDEQGRVLWYEFSPNGQFSFHSGGSGAVRCIRQLTLLAYKLRVPYSTEEIDKFTDAFVSVDSSLPEVDFQQPAFDGWTVGDVLVRAGSYIRTLLSGVNPLDVRPKHGSGQSACRTKPKDRYYRPRFVPQLHQVYPEYFWFYWNLVHRCDERANVEVLMHPASRLTFVPKDSRGPRVICMEPRELMFIQQGQMDLLYKAILRYRNVAQEVSCLTQDRNQIAAQQGSIFGDLATLDLKEASDRVSLDLVRTLFPDNWVQALEASRSTHCELPDGRLIRLRKFAPMGSACCFPVESLVFWAILRGVIDLVVGSTPSIRHSRMPLRVFGDDIVLPHSIASKAISALEAVGLMVNRTKSYLSGPFRESCGADFFAGDDVSYVRTQRAFAPDNWGTQEGLFRLRDQFNEAILKYGFHLTAPLVSLFKEITGRSIPVTTAYAVDHDWDGREKISPPSGCLALIGLTRDYGVRAKTRLGRYCSLELKCLRELPVYEEQDLDDRCHLVRWGLHGSQDRPLGFPYRVALPKRHKYKYGWVRL